MDRWHHLRLDQSLYKRLQQCEHDNTFGEQELVIDHKPWLQFEQEFRSRAAIIGIRGAKWRSLVDAVK